MRLPPALVAVRSRAGVRPALIAYALYGLVEFASWLAVTLWAFDRGGAALASTVAVVQLVPSAVLAPAAAALGDRLPRPRALLLAHLAVAAGVALTATLLSASAPVPLVVAAGVLATTAVAVVRPVHFAALPGLARRADELVSANALSSFSDGFALFAGPALAGWGVAASGPAPVLWGCAAAAAAAALVCTRPAAASPRTTGDAEDEPEPGWRGALAGLRVLAEDPGALALLVTLAVAFVVAGALDVLGIAYSTAVLHLGATGSGLLIGALGAGGLVGAAVGGGLGRRRSLSPLVLAGGVLLGVAFAAVAAVHALAPALLAITLVGSGETVMLVAGRTLLQRVIDDAVLARVFAVQEATTLVGLALGAAVVPALVRSTSVAGAFAVLGVGATACTVAVAPLARRLDARALYLPRELGLLRGVGFLAPLSPPALERLARRARWVELVDGQAAVRLGEPGRDFYVVAEGTFAVTTPAGHAPDLGLGDGFGEVALVRQVPRTATVTAVGPGLLLAVSGRDFLAALTGSPDSAVAVDRVAQAHLDRPDAGTAPAGAAE